MQHASRRATPQPSSEVRCPHCHETFTPDAPSPSLLYEGTSPEPPSNDTIRLLTSSALDDEEHRYRAFVAAVLGPLTVGIQPVVHAETAFANHCSREAASVGPIPTVSREVVARLRHAREWAFEWSRFLCFARALPVAVAQIGAASALFVIAVDGHGRVDDWLAAWIAQLVLMGATTGYLHAFRETVRRHEHHQTFTRLVSEAVSPSKTKEVTGAIRRGWTGRRVVDLALTLVAAVPLIGFLALPVVAARLQGTLRHHERNDRFFPKRGR